MTRACRMQRRPTRSCQTMARGEEKKACGSEERRLRGRCTRSERRARRLTLSALLKMRENALDQRRVLDARNHHELPAAAPTLLDREHAFEPEARRGDREKIFEGNARKVFKRFAL
jgi:hypothetical protein